jgi:hypothetical protein
MNMKKIFGFVAVAGLLFVAAPAQQASAASLNSPAVAAAVQQGGTSEAVTTQVHYRRGWHGGMRRHYGWHRPHYMRRHYGWGRPHHWHRRHWR